MVMAPTLPIVTPAASDGSIRISPNKSTSSLPDLEIRQANTGLQRSKSQANVLASRFTGTTSEKSKASLTRARSKQGVSKKQAAIQDNERHSRKKNRSQKRYESSPSPPPPPRRQSRSRLVTKKLPVRRVRTTGTAPYLTVHPSVLSILSGLSTLSKASGSTNSTMTQQKYDREAGRASLKMAGKPSMLGVAVNQPPHAATAAPVQNQTRSSSMSSVEEERPPRFTPMTSPNTSGRWIHGRYIGQAPEGTQPSRSRDDSHQASAPGFDDQQHPVRGRDLPGGLQDRSRHYMAPYRQQEWQGYLPRGVHPHQYQGYPQEHFAYPRRSSISSYDAYAYAQSTRTGSASARATHQRPVLDSARQPLQHSLSSSEGHEPTSQGNSKSPMPSSPIAEAKPGLGANSVDDAGSSKNQNTVQPPDSYQPQQIPPGLPKKALEAPPAIFRRFMPLHNRILTQIQSDLSTYESQLQALEQQISSYPGPDMAYLQSLQARRRHMLSNVFEKLGQYNSAVELSKSTLALKDPLTVDLFRLQSLKDSYPGPTDVDAGVLLHQDDLFILPNRSEVETAGSETELQSNPESSEDEAYNEPSKATASNNKTSTVRVNTGLERPQAGRSEQPGLRKHHRLREFLVIVAALSWVGLIWISGHRSHYNTLLLIAVLFGSTASTVIFSVKDIVKKGVRRFIQDDWVFVFGKAWTPLMVVTLIGLWDSPVLFALALHPAVLWALLMSVIISEEHSGPFQVTVTPDVAVQDPAVSQDGSSETPTPNPGTEDRVDNKETAHEVSRSSFPVRGTYGSVTAAETASGILRSQEGHDASISQPGTIASLPLPDTNQRCQTSDLSTLNRETQSLDMSEAPQNGCAKGSILPCGSDSGAELSHSIPNSPNKEQGMSRHSSNLSDLDVIPGCLCLSCFGPIVSFRVALFLVREAVASSHPSAAWLTFCMAFVMSGALTFECAVRGQPVASLFWRIIFNSLLLASAFTLFAMEWGHFPEKIFGFALLSWLLSLYLLGTTSSKPYCRTLDTLRSTRWRLEKVMPGWTHEDRPDSELTSSSSGMDGPIGFRILIALGALVFFGTLITTYFLPEKPFLIPSLLQGFLLAVMLVAWFTKTCEASYGCYRDQVLLMYLSALLSFLCVSIHLSLLDWALGSLVFGGSCSWLSSTEKSPMQDWRVLHKCVKRIQNEGEFPKRWGIKNLDHVVRSIEAKKALYSSFGLPWIWIGTGEPEEDVDDLVQTESMRIIHGLLQLDG